MSEKRQVRKENSGKELAELKRENNQLKRKVAKLQRQLQKALEGLFTQEDDEQPSVPALPKEPKQLSGCPECGQALKKMAMPTGVMSVCPGCKWRKFKSEVPNDKEQAQ